MQYNLRLKLKTLLLKTGLYYTFYFIRSIPEVVKWVFSGCTSFPPHAVKLHVIKSYIEKFSIKHFVETGTFRGDTLEYIAKTGIKCTSIELSQRLYMSALERFRNYKNVTLVHGDSSTKIDNILQFLDEPALFWLDGHYSGGFTAHGITETPVMEELSKIFNHHIKDHVILIDDAHCFNGKNDYPRLDELLGLIRLKSNHEIEISADIIRLTPV